MRHVSVQQLSAFVDSALSGVSRELVTRHLTTCASCREKHAQWVAADEALRQALAWTPTERSLEEWSSRVELCITAERRGLPTPEFTPTLLPMTATASPSALLRMRELLEGARGAMLSNTRELAAANETERAAASEAPQVQREDEAANKPELAHAGTPEVEPAPRHEPVLEAEPEVLPEPAPMVEPAPRLSNDAVPGPTAWWSMRPRRLRGNRRLLATSCLLLAVLLTSLFMPEVIRVPLPQRWLPRMPRVEFVRQGSQHASGPEMSREPVMRLTAREPVVPELVPQEPRPVPGDRVASGDSAPKGNGSATSPAHARAPLQALPAPADARTTPAAVAVARSAERSDRRVTTASSSPQRTTAAAAAPSRPAAEPTLVPDNPATIVPVRVETSLRLSASPVRMLPEPERDEEWPLLCGEVIDAEGLPVEGARVQLVSPSLTLRTDRRGRFCVACPPGTRALRVEAAGFPVVNRTVELSGGMVETRIALPPAR